MFYGCELLKNTFHKNIFLKLSMINGCVYFQSEIWIHMPLVVYGILALLIGAWSLVLPETLNKKLPDTIEDLIDASEK